MRFERAMSPHMPKRVSIFKLSDESMKRKYHYALDNRITLKFRKANKLICACSASAHLCGLSVLRTLAMICLM